MWSSMTFKQESGHTTAMRRLFDPNGIHPLSHFKMTTSRKHLGLLHSRVDSQNAALGVLSIWSILILSVRQLIDRSTSQLVSL